MFTISAVLPIEGRPAIITRSAGWNPTVNPSRCPNRLATPVTWPVQSSVDTRSATSSHAVASSIRPPSCDCSASIECGGVRSGAVSGSLMSRGPVPGHLVTRRPHRSFRRHHSNSPSANRRRNPITGPVFGVPWHGRRERPADAPGVPFYDAPLLTADRQTAGSASGAIRPAGGPNPSGCEVF